MYTGEVRIKNRVLSADMYYRNALVLKYTIHYPWFESPEFPSLLKINQQYAAKAIAYQQYCETSLYQTAAEEYDNSVINDYPVRVFESYVGYNVTYNRDCTLSLYYDKYEYTGGAHGMTVRYSDTWDLLDGRRIGLEQIYPEYKDQIIKIITDEIAEQMQSGNGWYFEDYEKRAAEYFNPEHFYLNDTGLVVYYQLYEIAPYASGIPVFTIPYSDKVKRPRCWQPPGVSM